MVILLLNEQLYFYLFRIFFSFFGFARHTCNHCYSQNYSKIYLNINSIDLTYFNLPNQPYSWNSTTNRLINYIQHFPLIIKLV